MLGQCSVYIYPSEELIFPKAAAPLYTLLPVGSTEKVKGFLYPVMCMKLSFCGLKLYNLNDRMLSIISPSLASFLLGFPL